MATTTRYTPPMTILGTLIAAPVAPSAVRRRMVRVLLTDAEMGRLDRARHGRSRSDALATMAGLRSEVNVDRAQMAALDGYCPVEDALQSTNGMRVGG